MAMASSMCTLRQRGHLHKHHLHHQGRRKLHEAVACLCWSTRRRFFTGIKPSPHRRLCSRLAHRTQHTATLPLALDNRLGSSGFLLVAEAGGPQLGPAQLQHGRDYKKYHCRRVRHCLLAEWALPEVHWAWQWICRKNLGNKYPSKYDCCQILNAIRFGSEYISS